MHHFPGPWLIGPVPVLLAIVCLSMLISIRTGRTKINKHTIGCVLGIGQLVVIVAVLASGHTTSASLTAPLILICAFAILAVSVLSAGCYFPLRLHTIGRFSLSIAELAQALWRRHSDDSCLNRLLLLPRSQRVLLHDMECVRWRCGGIELAFGRYSGPVPGLWLVSAIFLVPLIYLMMGSWGLYLKARRSLWK